MKLLGMYEFLPHNNFITNLGEAACNDDAPTQMLCETVMFLFEGFDPEETNAVCLFFIFARIN